MSAAGPDLGGPRAARRLTAAVMLGTLTFNAALCLINTGVVRITDFSVMASEAILVSVALALSLRRNAAPYLVLAVLLSYGALLMALRSQLDLKAVRDALIPIAFYVLGRRWSDPALVDRIALAGGGVVIAVGLFESLALETYVRYFNVSAFYAARDNLAAAAHAAKNGLGAQSSALFESGFRYDARTILPVLGPHRVSSVFLEPVSMGNFGALLSLWALHRRQAAHRWPMLAIGLLAIVLADARFGLAVCLFGAVALLGARRIPPVWGFALPFLIMAGFAVYGHLSAEVAWANDFAGRMLWSARLLTSLGPEAVWGLSAEKPFLADSGYAYTLNQIGLLGFAGLWTLFIFVPSRGGGEAWRFKLCMAVYICLLLMISGSIYSIKTAALLWFMVGACDGFVPAARDAGARARAGAGREDGRRAASPAGSSA